uniref:SGNH hydrolase-type esterase domain-containing protein n=1 Tax=Calcidiscus leptoporus TaxID=127549 RepID=A0A7S0NZ80_9EUKA|mmetsp:Transcript_41924/g.98247  ORF Transcript_41924/g.98247 Transcript_41924/m.98247 type:complete len:407 (+) Transcript_41924:271-1491(+)
MFLPPKLTYEGRWDVSELRARSDWPCSSVHFGVSVGGGGGGFTIRWHGARSRINLTVTHAETDALVRSAVLEGPWFDPLERPRVERLGFERGVRGRFAVRLRKLTQATPLSMGLATKFFAPSVLSVYGVSAHGDVQLFSAAAPTRQIQLIGASDTAGYCVDGTPHTSSLADTLLGYHFSDCDGAYGADLGRRFAAHVSVQALAGAGLTQNANAARVWEEGPLTMADLFNRTLQTESAAWNVTTRLPHIIILSLGGNDYNHQQGRVPSNASFEAAYVQLLRRLDYARARAASVPVLSVCGMGDPTEAARDPDNNRCRPCPHVEQAVRAFAAGQPPRRRIEYLFIPCDGSVVSGAADLGCAGHKNWRGQRRVADFIAPAVARLTGWSTRDPSRSPLLFERTRTIVDAR